MTFFRRLYRRLTNRCLACGDRLRFDVPFHPALIIFKYRYCRGCAKRAMFASAYGGR